MCFKECVILNLGPNAANQIPLVLLEDVPSVFGDTDVDRSKHVHKKRKLAEGREKTMVNAFNEHKYMHCCAGWFAYLDHFYPICSINIDSQGSFQPRTPVLICKERLWVSSHLRTRIQTLLVGNIKSTQTRLQLCLCQVTGQEEAFNEWAVRTTKARLPFIAEEFSRWAGEHMVFLGPGPLRTWEGIYQHLALGLEMSGEVAQMF